MSGRSAMHFDASCRVRGRLQGCLRWRLDSGRQDRNELRLFIESNSIRFRSKKADLITIPASSVTEISYGQDVHRRIGAAIGLAVVSLGIGALMALTKSKKHFVGLTWADGDQKGGFAIQCDKSDYRGILAGLEGVTGKKAVDSDALTVKTEGSRARA